MNECLIIYFDVFESVMYSPVWLQIHWYVTIQKYTNSNTIHLFELPCPCIQTFARTYRTDSNVKRLTTRYGWHKVAMVWCIVVSDVLFVAYGVAHGMMLFSV